MIYFLLWFLGDVVGNSIYLLYWGSTTLLSGLSGREAVHLARLMQEMPKSKFKKIAPVHLG